ncbi:hypothetical protein [Sporosarcina sp. Te-1]|uniref:hypothetical protein n=1 Tax=Sporosarcina sp. Te-1 TaxID=2818390 RepID=UPI001A9FB46F|nr:hypothetical protein [Sporosarcina sp. Te-1]QTD40824.1 hypothetical protein J3U78_19085 [Sporosarcina sp. Te-1]
MTIQWLAINTEDAELILKKIAMNGGTSFVPNWIEVSPEKSRIVSNNVGAISRLN